MASGSQFIPHQMLINNGFKAISIIAFSILSTIGYGQTLKDTSKSKGANPINVIGNSNHIVGGNGNTVGINGDVIVNPNRKLTNDYLEAIGKYIDNLVQNKNFDGDHIIVSTESYATYPDMTQQIIEYLKTKGYKATEGYSTTAPTIQEIKIDTLFINHVGIHNKDQKKRIEIMVGKFKR